MIVKEPFLADYFANPFIKYGFELLMVALVIGIGTYVKSKRKEPQKQAA
jgi:hypothetical protein